MVQNMLYQIIIIFSYTELFASSLLKQMSILYLNTNNSKKNLNLLYVIKKMGEFNYNDTKNR